MPEPSSFSEAMTNAQDHYLRDIACGTRDVCTGSIAIIYTGTDADKAAALRGFG